MNVALHTLSLCSGVAGLDIGIELALGPTRAICYVEREISAAEILAARMEEGSLEPAPIWSDIATFDGRRLRGMVDIVSAGFPCPDYSVAGRREGRFGKHGQVWDHVRRIICEVRPGICVLENVPGIYVPHGRDEWVLPAGLWFVLGDLAAMGFDAEWGCIRASDVGAPHMRARWFCLAYARCQRDQRWGKSGVLQGAEGAERCELSERKRHGNATCNVCADVAYSQGRGCGMRGQPSGRGGLADWGCAAVGQPNRPRRQAARRGSQEHAEGEPEPAGGTVADPGNRLVPQPRRGPEIGDGAGPASIFPPGPDDAAAWAAIIRDAPWLAPATEPGICVSVDGSPVVVDAARSDQLRACGNGVVPLQAAVAVRELCRRAGLMP